MKRCLALVLILGMAAGAARAQHARPNPEETLRASVDPRIPAYKPIAGLKGELRGVESDTMYYVAKLWIDDFTKLYPSVSIHVVPSGSHTAGPGLADGSADFGLVAREMLPKEEAAFTGKFRYKPLGIAISGGSWRIKAYTDANAFFVNGRNPLKQITMAQLDAIYSKTRRRGYPRDIATWGQLGLKGAWADKPIHLWGVKVPNGFEHFLQERVLEGGEWRDDIQTRDTVIPLPAMVAADPYAIGYSGYSWLTPGVRPLAVADTPAGPYYACTFANVASQKYPLSRVLYVFVNKRPGKPLDPVLREFIRFLLSRQGQQDVVKDGIFTPLPLSFIAKAEAKLR
ncbi:MAG TPA: substrate-binding domain-containing protein [Candidatus Acidoferrales bacterium]|nr:substrate-binding domain-containing protein [Candidatus Acidoferrales bacterium]